MFDIRSEFLSVEANLEVNNQLSTDNNKHSLLSVIDTYNIFFFIKSSEKVP